MAAPAPAPSSALEKERDEEENVLCEAFPKPFLGGYRHKKTGVTYHHASSQSVEFGLIVPRKSFLGHRSRDTQTHEMKTRSTQNKREYGTQMQREDVIMEADGDRQVTPRPYFTSAECFDLRTDRSLVIQRYWRGYLSRRLCWGIRQRERERQKAEEEKVEALAEHDRARQKHEVERRVNPQSKRDFDLLCNELETWRIAEVSRVSALSSSSEEKKKATVEMLAQHTKALQTLDQLKLRAQRKNKSKRAKHLMDLMAMPKQWQVGNGEVAQVCTPHTTRAAELRDLYVGLVDPTPSIDDRLQVLLNVKWTVQEFSCSLTRDIVELCDREADLLGRGRPEKSLEGLRRRLSNMVSTSSSSPCITIPSTFNPPPSVAVLSVRGNRRV